MPIVNTNSPLTGQQYSFTIAGNEPTDEERKFIANYILSQENPQPLIQPDLEAPQPPPDETNMFADFAQGVGSGFLGSFAQLPGGIASLIDAGERQLESRTGLDLGDYSKLAESGQSITNYAQNFVDEYVGVPGDTVAGKSGQALGSLASFFVPGLGIAKTATAVGAGVKTAAALGTGTAALQGVGLGSQQQAGRIQERLEKGQVIEQDAQDISVLLGGAIGATEALPVGRVLGQLGNILKKVPKNKSDEAFNTIKNRLKRAGANGLVEGGQEVFAAVSQDFVSKGLYDPDLEVGLSAYDKYTDDAIYGGGAGAVFSFFLDSLAGRKRTTADLNKSQQLESDLREEGVSAKRDFESSKIMFENTRDPEDVRTEAEIGIEETQEAQKESAISPIKAEEGTTPSDKNVEPQQEAAKKYSQNQYEKVFNKIKKARSIKKSEIKKTVFGKNVKKGSNEVVDSIISDLMKDGKIRFKNVGVDTKGKPKLNVNEFEYSELTEENKQLLDDLSTSLNETKKQADDLKLEIISLPEGAQEKDTKSNQLNSLNENIKTTQSQINEIKKNTTNYFNDAETATEKEIAQQAAEDAKIVEDNLQPYRDDYEDVKFDVYQKLYKFLQKMGVARNVKLKLVDTISPGKAEEMVEGSFELEDGKRVITLAMGLYDPNLTQEQYYERLKNVMTHELVHAFKNLGLFTDKEFQTLINLAEKQNYIHVMDGKPNKREYTFLDRAIRMNPELDLMGQQEEAVAEMFRAYLDGRLKIGGKPRNLFQRIIKFIKEIFNVHNAFGIRKPEDIFKDFESGVIGKRKRNLQKIKKNTEKFSRTLIPFTDRDYSVNKLGFENFIKKRGLPLPANIIEDPRDRRPLDFKDVTTLTPELTQAANLVLEKRMTLDEYDKIVNQFKPILPYDPDVFLNDGGPIPATPAKMKEVLDSNKKDKVNSILNNKIKIDNEKVYSLRLDIPSYKRHGVWIPTIHLQKEAIAHEAGAVMFSPNFEQSPANRLRALKIAAHASKPFREGRKPEKYTKEPFATINGYLGDNSVVKPEAVMAEAKRLMQKLKDGGNVAQVGFDPERHGYFYDRYTTEPIDSADSVVQIGPLLLADNPQYGLKAQSFLQEGNVKYSKRAISFQTPGVTNEIFELTTAPFIGEDGEFLYQHRVTEKGLVAWESKENAVERYHNWRGNIFIDPVKDRDTLKTLMKAEGELALRSNNGALGWYDRILRLAKDLLSKDVGNKTALYPELNKESDSYDPGMEAAFDFVLAVTSNGEAVKKNFTNAAKAYDGFRRTGFFADIGVGGVRGPAMKKSLMFYNALKREKINSFNQLSEIGKVEYLKDKRMDEFNADLEIADFLQEEIVMGDLQNDPVLKQFKIEPQGALKDDVVNRAILIGPKIGQGFYMNLRGNFDKLTADIWWTRFWRRLIGKPFKIVEDKTINKNINDAKIFIQQLTNPSIRNVPAVYDKENLKWVTDPKEFSKHLTELKKQDGLYKSPAIIRDIEQKIYDEALQKVEEDYDARREEDYKEPFKVTDNNIHEVAQKYYSIYQTRLKAAEKGDPIESKTQLTFALERLAANTLPQLEATPGPIFKQGEEGRLTGGAAGDIERSQMQKITEEVVEEMNKELGLETGLTVADYQASVWYHEKRFFRSLGIAPGNGDTTDYIDGVIQLLKEKNYDEADIETALPNNERFRLDDTRTVRTGGKVIGEEFREGRPYTPKDYGERAEPAINLRKLAGQIAANPFGYTVLRGEGFTIQDTTIPLGNVVAPVKDTEMKIDISKGIRLEDLKRYCDYSVKIQKIMGRPTFLGGWLNTNTNEYCLDTTIVVKDRNDSLYVAESAEQDGIYDIKEAVATDYERGEYDTTTEIRELEKLGGIDHNRRNNIRDVILKVKEEFARVKDTSEDGEQIKSKIRFSKRSVAPGVISNIDDSANDFRKRENIIQYTKVGQLLEKSFKFTKHVPYLKNFVNIERLITRAQDSMYPLGKLLDDLRAKGYNFRDAADPYLQQMLFTGRASSKLGVNQENLYKPIVSIVKDINVSNAQMESLKGVSETYRDFYSKPSFYKDQKLALFDLFLLANHAKERNKYIKDKNDKDSGSGISDIEADAILNWFNTLNNNQINKFRDAQSLIKKVVDNTNLARQESGLQKKFTPDEATGFVNYVPLRHNKELKEELDADLAGEPQVAMNNLYGARGKLDQTLQGRENLPFDIMANVFVQNQNSLQKGERNKVGNSFAKMLLEVDEQNNSLNGTRIGTIIKQKDPMNEDHNNRVLTIKADQELVDNYRNEDGTPLFEVGKDVHIYIDDLRIARAMKGASGLDTNSYNFLTKGLGKLNRLLSNLNTTWNPEFVITNFARDLTTAGINVSQYEQDRVAAEVVRNSFKAMGAIMRVEQGKEKKMSKDGYSWDDVYRDFVANGGQSATNMVEDLQDTIDKTNSILKEAAEETQKGKHGIAKNLFISKPKSIFKLLIDTNTAAENGVRLTTYKSLIDRGFTKQRAAEAAKNVTVNFGKAGEDKVLMNSYYLFYNASIQGTHAMLNAAMKSKRVRKIWGGLVIYGFLQDQFMSMFSDDEDEDGRKDYDELSDYTLEHNFLLPTFDLAEGKFIKIPMPYGFNALFNFGRVMSRRIRGEYTTSQATVSSFGTLLDALSPVGGFEQLGTFLSPTALDPFIQTWTNKDYAGRPIVKEGSPFGPATPDSQRHWNNTGEVSKAVANFFNSATGGTKNVPGYLDFSPDLAEFWFDYFTGGAGMFARRVGELPTKTVDFLKGDFDGDIFREIPFARKVAIGASKREDTGVFIEARDSVLQRYKDFEDHIKAGDRDSAMAVRNKYKKQFSVLGYIKGINSARNRLLRLKNQINDNPRIPEEIKADRIRKINDQVNELVRKANIRMREAEII